MIDGMRITEISKSLVVIKIRSNKKNDEMDEVGDLVSNMQRRDDVTVSRPQVR